MVAADYVKMHPDLVERAKRDVEERKLFIKSRKQPSQDGLVQSLMYQMLREVATRWCNGKLMVPTTNWFDYLKKVHDANQKKEKHL